VTGSTAMLNERVVVGRYVIHDEIARGGMATVHLGRLLGPVGFSRIVAIKRLHGNLARDPEFTAMFLDEARLAARIRHPNVVATLDVVAQHGELFLVMDYVHGQSLSWVLSNGNAFPVARIPLRVLGAVMSGVLQGLHAAHEASSDRGEPLGIVHRDVSPQNVLIGDDGTARIVDFGIAKAVGRLHNTRGGQIKGKIEYMAPEQVLRGELTRQTDIWGASVVLWRAITGRKLFSAPSDGQIIYQILEHDIPPPSRFATGISPQLDAVILKGLEREPSKRYASARDMAIALENSLPVASQREVAEWILSVAAEELEQRAEHIARIESVSPESARSPNATPRPPAMADAQPGVLPGLLMSAASPSTNDRTNREAATRPDGDAALLRPTKYPTPHRNKSVLASIILAALLVVAGLVMLQASTSRALPSHGNGQPISTNPAASSSALAPAPEVSSAFASAPSPAPTVASTRPAVSASPNEGFRRSPHRRSERRTKEDLYVRE